MRIVWDPEKARLNRTKHGIAFPDAERCSSIPRR
jgi:uncharacterized DUF497 family protein